VQRRPRGAEPDGEDDASTRAHVWGVHVVASPRHSTDPDAKTAPASSALTTAIVQHTIDAMNFQTLTFAAIVAPLGH